MVFVSITRLRIRSLRFMPAFVVRTLASLRQVRGAEGFLQGSLLPDRRRTFWTMTLWQDQAAMRRYMTSGSHLAAMPRLLGWCDEASIVHWQQEGDVLPDWTEADRRMRSEGRPSKVRHPAAHHPSLGYPAPQLGRAAPITRK
ncbi:hypothetical protein GGQ80_002671 [Sphingomonas jinjuensis]|uniref:DUF3291 domain-containing protein n=1 Tax=Sphingomonas jinjuensis TaxID=535907 RepID=A0A840FN83_9SPHN|nr:antibiotic biosynthesis monooxygenase [Sphingomonas jinjuensis]MBB4154755.1 hypothetical protein [Sphingomonas jinjuensis]